MVEIIYLQKNLNFVVVALHDLTIYMQIQYRNGDFFFI